MKKLSFILYFIFLSFSLNAQRSPEKILNVGISVPRISRGIPIGFVYDAPIKNNFSIGGALDFARYGQYGGHLTSFYFGGRVCYHAGEVMRLSDNRFDPYMGTSVGLNISTYKGSGSGYYTFADGRTVAVYFGLHIGARYLFGNNWGAFAEAGFGTSALRVGLTMVL
jgi:hypothetical protein